MTTPEVPLPKPALHGARSYDAAQMRTYAAEVYESRYAALRAIVDEQAEDEGLWFKAETAPEAYLKQELRKLHAAVESTPQSIPESPRSAFQRGFCQGWEQAKLDSQK